ncbi:unnamed protein product [Protopolystoma xenopodis]|uniref:Uncharacterized protein n=1 Tax=Protopolystoma xenopodis TaxID=117903 RepID=A0A3S5AXS9_9PLAT|nr:unnamed protein product [Protopolystoma xenopodis]
MVWLGRDYVAATGGCWDTTLLWVNEEMASRRHRVGDDEAMEKLFEMADLSTKYFLGYKARPLIGVVRLTLFCVRQLIHL